MTTGKTGSSLLLRNKVHTHFPVSKAQPLLHKEGPGGSMNIMTHFAVPALVPVNMNPVKIPGPIPESCSPLCFFRFQKVRIMTKKAEAELFCAGRQVVLLGVAIHQKITDL
jgi:hypothetical protein